jgi:hypothetical protein
MGVDMGVDDVLPESAGPQDPFRSSRLADSDAGWNCREPGRFTELMGRRTPSFSWLRPSALWRSRNDVLARLLDDPTDRRRRQWVEARIAAGTDPDFRIAGPARDSFSFLVLGDTGEGDMSQYAVVPCLLARATGTEFAIFASDVIYPDGGVGGYAEKFFRPYQAYPRPIYAVPGNHDWYDGLAGFMRVFCEALPPDDDPPSRRPLRGWLCRLLWRASEAADEQALSIARALRAHPRQLAAQPGPYWMIDTPSLRIVGIDTGIRNKIDADQGRWLRRVSAGSKPKLLVTGKPIYRDNRHFPCPIEGGGHVDDLVRDPACGYVAVIGGDIHNYQRYPVRVGRGRVVNYIVAGGGGAFMHATHPIPRIDVAGVDESEFRCYPLRGDSLSFYSQLYDRRLRTGGLLAISPTDAAAYMSARIGTGTSPRLGARAPGAVGPRVRMAAWILRRLPVGRVFHRWFSEFSDWDHPPFFKSFLRVDVSRTALRVRCFAATGCREHEQAPPLEDEVTIPLTAAH